MADRARLGCVWRSCCGRSPSEADCGFSGGRSEFRPGIIAQGLPEVAAELERREVCTLRRFLANALARRTSRW